MGWTLTRFDQGVIVERLMFRDFRGVAMFLRSHGYTLSDFGRVELVMSDGRPDEEHGIRPNSNTPSFAPTPPAVGQ